MQVGMKNSESEQDQNVVQPPCDFPFEMNDGLPSIVCFESYNSGLYVKERGQNADCFVPRMVDFKRISLKKRTWSL